MSELELTSHKVLVFDVYGTLIDWESGIYNSLKPLFPKDTPREEVLQKYAAAELDLQMKDPSVPYSKILHLAWLQLSGQANTTLGSASSTLPTSDAERFGASIPTWQPFDDTVQALHRLKKHFALVVLSNVDNRSFGGTHELLKSKTHEASKSRYPTDTPDSPFSLILTAQQLNAYKPDLRVLETALQQVSSAPRPLIPHPSPPWGVGAREVLVVANSLLHDIEPANLHSLNSVWISRHEKNIIGSKSELKERGTWTWRFETLGDLADAVDQEVKEARGAT
ncbi:HAD-like domain-containing protein [Suillus subaureus]|uniref:HAD-like domain-containing protein n=1 Tax=Suillus subaureus TaxID=48587 RepID=A0A9P7EJ97_9AGAM|nr:HAD-like domain-containing protein [Suillus subaureus]KAG1823547.1 HAD-like domain-containing protein [Suillus subaureus]